VSPAEQQRPRRIAERLALAGCVAAGEEAEEMVALAPDRAALEAWVRRREQGEPLAWITGGVAFCGRTVRVRAGVYVPRAQTEDLAERAAARLPAGGRAADLCTGSGAVAVHLAAAVPTATVVAADLYREAVACAADNGLSAVVCDLDCGLRPHSFDVVTAAAPYVPTGHLRLLPRDVVRYEPIAALDGGADGLDVVRRVVAGAARLLRPGGWMLTEIGGEQDRALAATLDACGFGETEAWRDAEGDLRGVAARRGHLPM
jgi:release factor glutamine methyltransferase